MINLGSGYYVFTDNILGIFDQEILDHGNNNEIINSYKDLGKYIDTCGQEKINSYVWCENGGECYVYTSSFKSKTLMERFSQGLEVINGRKE